MGVEWIGNGHASFEFRDSTRFIVVVRVGEVLQSSADDSFSGRHVTHLRAYIDGLGNCVCVSDCETNVIERGQHTGLGESKRLRATDCRRTQDRKRRGGGPAWKKSSERISWPSLLASTSGRHRRRLELDERWVTSIGNGMPCWSKKKLRRSRRWRMTMDNDVAVTCHWSPLPPASPGRRAIARSRRWQWHRSLRHRPSGASRAPSVSSDSETVVPRPSLLPFSASPRPCAGAETEEEGQPSNRPRHVHARRHGSLLRPAATALFAPRQALSPRPPWMRPRPSDASQ